MQCRVARWVRSRFLLENFEKESLVHEEIAAFLDEVLEDSLNKNDLLIVGAGHTTQAFKRHLGNEGTLLGVDLFKGSELIVKDATEKQIFEALSELSASRACKLIVSVIGGQGFIFGRGNQQLSPRILEILLRQIWERGDLGAFKSGEAVSLK